MVKKTEYNEVGELVAQTLNSRQLRQSQLAKRLEHSRSYLSQMMTYKNAKPEWLDLVANALNMTDEERRELHLRGARGQGFKL